MTNPKDVTKGVSTYVVSNIRTLAPQLVGLILAWPIAKPILEAFGVDSMTAAIALAPVVATILSQAYYAIVRKLEEKWPKIGTLLGKAALPTYVDPAGNIVSPPAKDPALTSAVIAGNIADTRSLPEGFVPNDPAKPDHAKPE